MIRLRYFIAGTLLGWWLRYFFVAILDVIYDTNDVTRQYHQWMEDVLAAVSNDRSTT